MSVPRTIATGDIGGTPVTLTTTTETVAVSSGNAPMPNQISLVIVLASLAWTAGTGTTSMQLRIRRGASATSPQIGQTYTHEAVAGASNSATIFAVDEQDNAFTAQYSLTAQQVGATGNGSVTSATILVLTY